MITPNSETVATPTEAGQAPLTNSRLSANLLGDYEALQNDLEQANQLAVDFQSQLAGKSNEMAHLKQVFEKTARDLSNLQAGITALREERHRLANEAMRAVALEHRLGRMEVENARQKTEAEARLAALAVEVREARVRNQAQEERIAQLLDEVKLKAELAAGRAPAVAPKAVLADAEARALLTTASDALARLRALAHASGPARKIPSGGKPTTADSEFIDISFER